MNRTVMMALVIIFLDAMGIGIIMPVLPALLREFVGKANVAENYGVLLALYAMMQSSQAAAAASATAAATSATASATSATASATSATSAAASAASAASAATAVVNSRVAGTANSIAKFTGANAVGNSLLSDDGATLNYTGTIFQINSNGPNWVSRKANAPTDQKFWRTYVSDSQLVFDVVNDAYATAQNYYIVTRSANSVTLHQWFVGGTERMRIDSSGNVGIGRTPAYVLDIGKNQNGATSFRVINTDTGSAATAEFILHSGTSKYVSTYVSGNNNEVVTYGSGGIVTQNSDFDTHKFRTIAGTVKLALSSTGVMDLNQSTGRIQIAATQVVGPRDTGWSAMTGSTNKNTTYDTSTVTLAQLAGRVMALQAALTTHGLIGT
jgi:hypothetical protein